MNNNARKWVKELPTYSKTRLYLKYVDGYCSLGVACDIAKRSGIKLKTRKKSGATSYNGVFYTLPESVKRFIGLRTSSGHFVVNQLVSDLTGLQIGRNCSLICLNDSFDLSFRQIADVIASEPKGLFDVRY